MSLSECVRTVKDPVIDRPEDDDVYEPAAEDLAWWSLQADAAIARAAAGSPLAGWLRLQAESYRSMAAAGSHAAWLAGKLEQLARDADWLGARTGDVFDDRLPVLEMHRDRTRN